MRKSKAAAAAKLQAFAMITRASLKLARDLASSSAKVSLCIYIRTTIPMAIVLINSSGTPAVTERHRQARIYKAAIAAHARRVVFSH